MKNLTNIIYQYKNQEFSYPQGLDCAVFVAKIMEEYSGKKIPNWREITTYKTYRGALKTIKKLGCKNFDEIPELMLGGKRDISEVKLGDAVYYINEQGRGILGVCNGVRAYFLQRGGGITARNVKECLYCWSID